MGREFSHCEKTPQDRGILKDKPALSAYVLNQVGFNKIKKSPHGFPQPPPMRRLSDRQETRPGHMRHNLFRLATHADQFCRFL
jgi:hypothetical protein